MNWERDLCSQVHRGIKWIMPLNCWEQSIQQALQINVLLLMIMILLGYVLQYRNLGRYGSPGEERLVDRDWGWRWRSGDVKTDMTGWHNEGGRQHWSLLEKRGLGGPEKPRTVTKHLSVKQLIKLSLVNQGYSINSMSKISSCLVKGPEAEAHSLTSQR